MLFNVLFCRSVNSMVEAKPKQNRTKQMSLKFYQSAAMYSVSSHIHSYGCSIGVQCFLFPNLFT